MNKPTPTIEIETFDVPCRIYGCFSTAKYKIGHMSGSPTVYFHVCESCMDSILASAPKKEVPFSEVEEVDQVVVEEEKPKTTKKKVTK